MNTMYRLDTSSIYSICNPCVFMDTLKLLVAVFHGKFLILWAHWDSKSDCEQQLFFKLNDLF